MVSLNPGNALGIFLCSSEADQEESLKEFRRKVILELKLFSLLKEEDVRGDGRFAREVVSSILSKESTLTPEDISIVSFYHSKRIVSCFFSARHAFPVYLAPRTSTTQNCILFSQER